MARNSNLGPMSTGGKIQSLNAHFLGEYTSQDAVLKYTHATAGFGISHLLDRDYKAIYCQALERLPAVLKGRGIHVLEFGCGAAMHLIHLSSILREKGIRLERAIGTDFSPVLIDHAKREAKTYLRDEDQRKIEFYVAKNESLIQDLADAAGVKRSRLSNSFDLILGVNTIRYCHRERREMDCARDIMGLLMPGGICVVIDMNDRFPAFRSRLKNIFRRVNKEEHYLPSLSEYAAPFEKVGFEVLRKEHFCWIPHSAGKLLCRVMQALSPILGAIAPTCAMRSLVVVRRPLEEPSLKKTSA
jgi:ubiquinone/menaquinone biosynthesis C-methylase UbiE